MEWDVESKKSSETGENGDCNPKLRRGRGQWAGGLTSSETAVVS